MAYRAMRGERRAVDEESTDTCIDDVLKPTRRNYDSRNISNADETGRFWRCLVEKTMVFNAEECHGGKKSKQRITVMVCANMKGTERSPIMPTGKFQNPRSSKQK